MPSYEFNRGTVDGQLQVSRSVQFVTLGMVGYTLIGRGGLTLSLGLGLGGGYSDIVTVTPAATDGGRGFIPSFGMHLNVGCVF